VQAARFQRAAACLAEMQIHTRQGQKRNCVLGMRAAAEFVYRNLSPHRGQSMLEPIILEFLDKCAPDTSPPLSATGALSLSSRVAGSAWFSSRSLPVLLP
jgi:hypothetical protein